jgi:hypothetical protein
MTRDREELSRGHHPPGDVLLHPAILVSIVLLLLNDFYLKSAHPGPLTWKLSDFAGLAFAPALVFSIGEAGASVFRRGPALASASGIWLSAAFTATVFALLKLVPGVGDLAARANDLLLAPVAGTRGPTVFIPDPTDLLALPAVLISVWAWYKVRG